MNEIVDAAAARTPLPYPAAVDVRLGLIRATLAQEPLKLPRQQVS